MNFSILKWSKTERTVAWRDRAPLARLGGYNHFSHEPRVCMEISKNSVLEVIWHAESLYAVKKILTSR